MIASCTSMGRTMNFFFLTTAYSSPSSRGAVMVASLKASALRPPWRKRLESLVFCLWIWRSSFSTTKSIEVYISMVASSPRRRIPPCTGTVTSTI